MGTHKPVGGDLLDAPFCHGLMLLRRDVEAPSPTDGRVSKTRIVMGTHKPVGGDLPDAPFCRGSMHVPLPKNIFQLFSKRC